MGPTHNGDAAFRKEAAGVAGIDYPQHLGSDIICDYYSLCGVSLSCAKTPAKRRFLRTCRIDEPRDASCAFHTRANRVELQIVRPSAARDGGWDRGMRDVSVETAWRREERPKTDGSFAYARPNASPFRRCFILDEFVLSRVPSPLVPLVRYPRRSSHRGVSLWLWH